MRFLARSCWCRSAAALALSLCVASAKGAEPPKYNEPPAPAPEISPPGRGPAETVMARPRPDYDPIGYDMGGFRIFPEVVMSAGYDDNIFRTDQRPQGDLISVVRPRVQMRSDFNQHRLDMTAEAAAGFYADHSSENFFDYRADARGHIDILRGLRLESALTFEHGHEDRGSVEAGAGAEPTEFDRMAALAVVAAQSGRFQYRAGISAASLDYQDVPAVGGGTINNDDRDHLQTDIFGRVSMGIGSDFRVFTSASLIGRDFKQAVDDSGVNRDSSGLSTIAGLEYDGGGLWFARGYAGFRQQVYSDATLTDVSGPVFGGQVTGNITPLTTVTGNFDRDIVDTSVTGASSYWDTSIRLRADHELLRNLILSGAVRARQNDFRGIDRIDRLFGGGLGLRWLLNRSFWLTLDADLDQRTSSGASRTQDFTQSRIFLRLVLQP